MQKDESRENFDQQHSICWENPSAREMWPLVPVSLANKCFGLSWSGAFHSNHFSWAHHPPQWDQQDTLWLVDYTVSSVSESVTDASMHFSTSLYAPQSYEFPGFDRCLTRWRFLPYFYCTRLFTGSFLGLCPQAWSNWGLGVLLISVCLLGLNIFALIFILYFHLLFES